MTTQQTALEALAAHLATSPTAGRCATKAMRAWEAKRVKLERAAKRTYRVAANGSVFVNRLALDPHDAQAHFAKHTNHGRVERAGWVRASA